MFSVVMCNRCSRRLQVVPAASLDATCSHCGLRAPIEAFRWLGSELPAEEARGMAERWNARLSRGLNWTEACEFRRLVP